MISVLSLPMVVMPRSQKLIVVRQDQIRNTFQFVFGHTVVSSYPDWFKPELCFQVVTSGMYVRRLVVLPTIKVETRWT